MRVNKERAKELVTALVPHFERMELTAIIGDTSRSVEFFVWIKGEKWQCYELADAGTINEAQMEKMFDLFAEAIRKNDAYQSGEVNHISVAC